MAEGLGAYYLTRGTKPICNPKPARRQNPEPNLTPRFVRRYRNPKVLPGNL